MRIDGGRELRGVFLVGAPRCGTTALSKSLRSHPEICVSKPKETFFFARPELGIPTERLGAELLRRYFPHLEERHRLIAEGTPWYLYLPESIDRILACDPEARFLVSVRNPVDLVQSQHARMLFTLDEDVQDFGRAWALHEERSQGRRIPARCREPRVIDYRFVGSLGTHLERLFAQVGRERCHVVVFDDVAGDGARVLRDVLEFIGVDPDLEIPFRRHRENAGYRHRWLQPFVINPPKPIARLIERWESRGKGRVAYFRPLRKRFKKWNTRPVERPALDPGLRRELRRFFAQEIEKLGKLLQRDLSHWR